MSTPTRLSARVLSLTTGNNRDPEGVVLGMSTKITITFTADDEITEEPGVLNDKDYRDLVEVITSFGSNIDIEEDEV